MMNDMIDLMIFISIIHHITTTSIYMSERGCLFNIYSPVNIILFVACIWKDGCCP